MAWRLARCNWHDQARLEAFLRDDWEPFAVTNANGDVTVWLRRVAEPAMAGVADAPRQRPGVEAVLR
jgi:hypothetical protein